MGTPLRLLLIDNSVDDTQRILSELARSDLEVVAERAETKEAAEDALKEKTWDAVLLEGLTPRLSCPEVITLLKEHGISAPLLVVSRRTGDDEVRAALRAGARDYLSKEHLARLALVIEREHKVAEERREHKRIEERLRVEKSLLECQLEAALDGILVVTEDAKISYFNRRFVQLWKIPEELIASTDDRPTLGFVVNSVLKPEEFLARVEHLYQHPNEESHEEIALKDGRLFERYSAPVKGLDGAYHGRIWFFRDITERKNVEAALQTSKSELQEIQERIDHNLRETILEFL